MIDKERLEAHLNNGKREYIMCAAIHLDDGIDYHHQPYNIDKGVVFCGWRHACIIQQYKDNLHWKNSDKVQGFLTNKNRFLTRDEGLELVRENGQLEKELIGGILTSEDLW